MKTENKFEIGDIVISKRSTQRMIVEYTTHFNGDIVVGVSWYDNIINKFKVTDFNQIDLKKINKFNLSDFNQIDLEKVNKLRPGDNVTRKGSKQIMTVLYNIYKNNDIFVGTILYNSDKDSDIGIYNQDELEKARP